MTNTSAPQPPQPSSTPRKRRRVPRYISLAIFLAIGWAIAATFAPVLEHFTFAGGLIVYAVWFAVSVCFVIDLYWPQDRDSRGRWV